jgi:ABC-2 type transport system permease protein
MSAFLYGLALQWRLDIRNKIMLVTCYIIPLLFFAFMGGIFSSINPQSRDTLIQSMCIFGVSMGALIGVPPSLTEIYSSDIKKVYKANGVPLYLGLITHYISGFIHLFIMCAIILAVAPKVFDAKVPANLSVYFISLAIFIATTLSIGSVLGLVMKNIPKLTMISQLVFLPSIMLSGIMFPVDLLPEALDYFGRVFPASWAYRSMTGNEFNFTLYLPMLAVLIIAAIVCLLVLNKKISE